MGRGTVCFILFCSEVSTSHTSLLFQYILIMPERNPPQEVPHCSLYPNHHCWAQLLFQSMAPLHLLGFDGGSPHRGHRAAWSAWDFSASLGLESILSLTQLLSTERLLLGWLHVENWSCGDPCLHSGIPLSVFDSCVIPTSSMLNDWAQHRYLKWTEIKCILIIMTISWRLWELKSPNIINLNFSFGYNILELPPHKRFSYE